MQSIATFFAELAPWLKGTLPGWLATATGVGILVRLQLGNRKLGIERRRSEAENSKTQAEAGKIDAEAEDIAMASLERQIGRLDERVLLLEKQVEECHQDRDLALAAARYLLDRLRICNPSDEAIEKLQPYLDQPPTFHVPGRIKSLVAEIDEADTAAGLTRPQMPRPRPA